MVVHIFTQLKKFLCSRPYVCDFALELQKPVPESLLAQWEQFNSCRIPDDLRNFYSTTDGVHLSWCSLSNDSKSQVGQIKISSLEGLVREELRILGDDSPPNADIDLFASETFGFSREAWPKRLFVIERCRNSSTVAILIEDQDSGVYLINRDASVYKLCGNFTQYIRLAVAHLGVLDWQAWYTPAGPTPQEMVQ
ncbi:unnamed protein product [Calicophoron daubneyi]|uniref:Knr4/Smi1-like domain-containing protein n=1 Tax=Calicophoron daubneyi TaxID=300641 RepID=A0AAV2T8N9_CALDB